LGEQHEEWGTSGRDEFGLVSPGGFPCGSEKTLGKLRATLVRDESRQTQIQFIPTDYRKGGEQKKKKSAAVH
jgi:hypothetical protein